MKKTLLSIVIASSVALVGCNETGSVGGISTAQGVSTVTLAQSMTFEEVSASLKKEKEILARNSLADIDQYIDAAANAISSVVRSDKEAVRAFQVTRASRSVLGEGVEVLVKVLIAVNRTRAMDDPGAELLAQLAETNEVVEALLNVPHFQLEFMNPELLGENDLVWFAAMQYAIDDSELETITAYDGFGNLRQMTQDEVNNEPTIIVGINEKMKLLAHDLDPSVQESRAATRAYMPDTVRVIKVNPGRPTEWGNLDIYHISATGVNEYVDTKFDPWKKVNKKNKDYSVNIEVARFNDDVCGSQGVMLQLWEQDWAGDKSMSLLGGGNCTMVRGTINASWIGAGKDDPVFIPENVNEFTAGLHTLSNSGATLGIMVYDN
jgi:hypothetical protein